MDYFKHSQKVIRLQEQLISIRDSGDEFAIHSAIAGLYVAHEIGFGFKKPWIPFAMLCSGFLLMPIGSSALRKKPEEEKPLIFGKQLDPE